MNRANWLYLAAGSVGVLLGWAAASARLRRREKLQARMLSFIAHEFNTPLTALNMTALNFTAGLFGPVPKEQLPWLVMLREQAARLSVLSGELRDFIHLELHGDIRLGPEPVALARVFSECVDAMKDSLARNGAILRADIPEHLPEVQADPDRLLRALFSMLSHARKFRASGPISAKAWEEGDSVFLAIEYASHKPFSREETLVLELYHPVHRKKSAMLESVGAGLGLTRLLLAAQGGSLRMDSGSEGSCRMILRLPKARR